MAGEVVPFRVELGPRLARLLRVSRLVVVLLDRRDLVGAVGVAAVLAAVGRRYATVVATVGEPAAVINAAIVARRPLLGRLRVPLPLHGRRAIVSHKHARGRQSGRES